jgi:hypothetical protein
MNPSKSDCLNCGCYERIKHLENENKVQWDVMDKHKEKVDKVFVKINQVLISLIILALGVIANLAYMILKAPKPPIG